MLRHRTFHVLMLVAVLALTASIAGAQDLRDYRIRITNLTHMQIFAPPVIAVHGSGARIFEAGMPASDALATLAEDGDGSSLMAGLMADSSVSQVISGDGVIMPGETVILELAGLMRPARLSVVGMLVSTNDAFFGLDSAPIAGGRPGRQVFMVSAWDAGSEANNESCDFIPGPPCGNPGVRATAGAEGYVGIHRGVQGIGDLAAAHLDWRGPVAKIEVVSVR